MRLTPPENDVHPPDDVCAACSAPLDEEEATEENSPASEGFCCEACMEGEGVVTDLSDLAELVASARADIEHISARVEHDTSCGAWCAMIEDRPGVRLGSIVEGVDQTTETHELPFPFRIERFWETVNDVEAEAQEIWDQTHGCDECGDEDPETGYTPVREDCPGCGGDGAII